MKRALFAAACSLAALSAAPALAQNVNTERFERQLQQIQRDTRMRIDPNVPVGQRTLVDYGGYFTLNFFAIDDTAQDTHILRQYDLVAYARVNVDGAHEFFGRARMSYRDFNDGDSFDGEGDETIWPTIEQAYYRFDLARYLGAYQAKDIGNNNVIVTVGREFVYWANGLVLAETLDGASANITLGNLDMTFLGGAMINDTVDIDSSRPQFDDKTERFVWGAMATYTIGKHRPFIYYLAQRDQNDGEFVIRTPNNFTSFEYNSWYIGAGSNGSIGDRLVYGLEFAYEGGKGLSNSFEPNTLIGIPQTEDDISAWALDARLDYLVPDVRHTRLSLETILASGDDDRVASSTNTFGGNTPNTDDKAFNAWGLLNTGLAFAPNVSNLIDVRMGASTFPMPANKTFRRMQLGGDLHLFWKMDSNAPIDELTTNDSFLGIEPDIYLNWQITSDLTFALRYGVFFPGDAIVDDTHPRNFFFAGLTFAF